MGLSSQILRGGSTSRKWQKKLVTCGMKKKNGCTLWKELLEQTNFADECIFEELQAGFKLCGQAKASGPFRLGHQPCGIV